MPQWRKKTFLTVLGPPPDAPGTGMHSTYDDRRARLRDKLNAKTPASDRPKFTVDGECEQELPIGLQTLVGNVLKLKYCDGMSAYPECKFSYMDVLWIVPGKEIDDDSQSQRKLQWGRTRFHIDYKRQYGQFEVDFLTHEALPKSFKERDLMMAEAACVVDVSNRKICMQYTLSDNCDQGFHRGNVKSNFLNGILMNARAWISVDKFPEHAQCFRLSCCKQAHALGITAGHNITQPMIVHGANASECLKTVLNLSQYEPLARVSTILPADGKPIRGKDLTAQKMSEWQAHTDTHEEEQVDVSAGEASGDA